MPKTTTAQDVLNAKTPAGAAKALVAFLKEHHNAQDISLWSPKEARERGRSPAWTVLWESGPFNWTVVSAGSTITAGESGAYSTPGPFPSGLATPNWHAEPCNSQMIAFYT